MFSEKKNQTPVRGQDGKISDTRGKDFYWSPTLRRLVGEKKSFPWVSEIFPSCPLTGVRSFISKNRNSKSTSLSLQIHINFFCSQLVYCPYYRPTLMSSEIFALLTQKIFSRCIRPFSFFIHELLRYDTFHCRSTRYGWYGSDSTTFFGWYGKPYHNLDRKK